MDKNAILKKLEDNPLDKEKITIVSGASLVMQDILDKTKDIDLTCDKVYYASLDWNTKIGPFGKEIKYKDVFEIGYDLYSPKNIVIINGYKCMDVVKCLKLKEKLNRKKDEKIIKVLHSYIENKQRMK